MAPVTLHIAPDADTAEAQAILTAAGLPLTIVRASTAPTLTVAGDFANPALKHAAIALWHTAPDLSLVGEYAQGLRFKLLLKSGIAADEAERSLAAFLTLIDDLTADRVSEADCTALLTYMPVAGTVLVTYDAGKIVPVEAKSPAH